MDIKIPQEQWGALVGAAVMQSVTQENRDTLIKEAISYLLTPQNKGAWEKGKTPLQEAFNRAVSLEAEKMISAEMEKDSVFTGKIRAVLYEALEATLAGEKRKKLIENASTAISNGFQLERSY